jgi:hypothetical protein
LKTDRQQDQDEGDHPKDADPAWRAPIDPRLSLPFVFVMFVSPGII